jgi:hypothetical protein
MEESMEGNGVGSVLSSTLKKVIPYTKRKAVETVKTIGANIVNKIKRKVKGTVIKRLGKRPPKALLGGGSRGIKKPTKKQQQKKKKTKKKSCIKTIKKKSSKVKTKADLFI